MTPARWRAERLAELVAHNETMRVLTATWRPPGGFAGRPRPEVTAGTLTASATTLRREARRLSALADQMTERAIDLAAPEA
jgi:hypothetical protein